MQPARDESDKRGHKDMIDWDMMEKSYFPDAVVIENEPDGCFLTSVPTGSKFSQTEVAMLQSGRELHSLRDDMNLLQSPLGSPTVSGKQEPPSPSTTLVDDESISSELTSVDSCLSESGTFASAETMKPNSCQTEAEFNTSQTILRARANLGTILSGRRHYPVHNRETPFTDPTEYYYDTFASKLRALSSKNSENMLCIDSYLAQSEAKWFRCVHGSRLPAAKSRAPSEVSSAYRWKVYHQNALSETQSFDIESLYRVVLEPESRTARGLRNFLLVRIGDWPVYSLFIALVRTKTPC